MNIALARLIPVFAFTLGVAGGTAPGSNSLAAATAWSPSPMPAIPPAAYGAHLTAFIADLHATFSPTLPFIFSRISANQTVYSAPSAPNHPSYLTLRAQQASVAATVPDAHLIDTDNPAFAMKSDHLHYSPLGQAFAAKLIHLLGQPAHGTILNTLDAEGLTNSHSLL